MSYVITVSLPGCLPVDDEPQVAETLDEARTALIAELWITADRHSLDVAHVEEQIREANAIPTTGGCVMLEGYAHEVHPTSGSNGRVPCGEKL